MGHHLVMLGSISSFEIWSHCLESGLRQKSFCQTLVIQRGLGGFEVHSGLAAVRQLLLCRLNTPTRLDICLPQCLTQTWYLYLPHVLYI
jgi:hypothetical protein